MLHVHYQGGLAQCQVGTLHLHKRLGVVRKN
jgi:hypothetical protein